MRVNCWLAHTGFGIATRIVTKEPRTALRYDIAFPTHSIPMKYVHDVGGGEVGGYMRGSVVGKTYVYVCVCMCMVEIGGFVGWRRGEVCCLEVGIWCVC